MIFYFYSEATPLIMNNQENPMKKNETFTMTRLVKSEDLNHHGTLFAGRMAEWFVEGCFIAAASMHGNPEEIVCVKLHGMKFSKPAQKGQIIKLTTRVVKTGNTSITVHGRVTDVNDQGCSVEGFITFVCIDEAGVKKPHGLQLPVPNTEDELKIYNESLSLS